MHYKTYKVEKSATRKEIGRELSREVFAVLIDKTRTVLGTDVHSSVLHTIGQRKVVAELCDKAGYIEHTYPEERAKEAYPPYGAREGG